MGWIPVIGEKRMRLMTGTDRRRQSRNGRTHCTSKLPALRNPVKGGMALKRPHVGRQEAEADRAAAVAIVDAVDHGRQFLAPLVGGIEQIRLVRAGGHEIE